MFVFLCISDLKNIKVTQDHITFVSKNLGNDVHRLGRELGLAESDLTYVIKDYDACGTQEIIFQVIQKWTDSVGSASIQSLCDALVKINKLKVRTKLRTFALKQHAMNQR